MSEGTKESSVKKLFPIPPQIKADRLARVAYLFAAKAARRYGSREIGADFDHERRREFEQFLLSEGYELLKERP